MKKLVKTGLWDIFSMSYILLLIIISSIKWHIYPIFVDIYYHIAAMQGYNLAGGVTLNSYWEYAPFGRPQLYPPLLHLFMLSLLKLKVPLIFVSKFTSFVMFPLALLTLYFVARAVFNEKVAFFSVIFLGSLYSFLWKSAVLSAASLTQILGLLAFYSIEKDKKIATPVIFTLMLYSHIAIPYFYLVSFIVYAFFRRERRKLILTSALISFIAFSPWLIHLFSNIQYLHPNNAFAEGNTRVPQVIPVYIFLWGFGILGALYSAKRKKEYLWPLLLLISLIPVAFFYPDRFWDTHVLIPLALLAGFGVWYLYTLLLNMPKGKRVISYAIFIAVLAIDIFVTPVLYIGEHYNVNLTNSTVTALLVRNEKENMLKNMPAKTDKALGNQPPNRPPMRTISILSKENLQLANFIRTKIQDGQTIYVPDGILADFIFAFSGHPVSSGMLREVLPYKRPLPTDCSFYVIPENVSGLLPVLNSEFTLFKKIGGYTIFKNKHYVKPIEPEKPVLPNWIVIPLIYLSILACMYDFSNPLDK